MEHWSDCSVYNEPAYPAGECDCGGIPETVAELVEILKGVTDDKLIIETRSDGTLMVQIPRTVSR